MKEEQAERLGKRELDIMNVLWERGSCSVHQVLEALADDGHDLAYNTIQTMLIRLERKGVVRKDTSNRVHLFSPKLQRPKAIKSAIRNIAERFFQGSAEALVAQLVTSTLSPKELKRVRKLIDDHADLSKK